jgi:hypothetical protein
MVKADASSDIYEDVRYPHLTLGAISILSIRSSLWTDERQNADGGNLNVRVLDLTGEDILLHCPR